jgi:hypothetical protein
LERNVAVPVERVREAELCAAVNGIGLRDESLTVSREMDWAWRKESDDAAN